jgi:hypothetical protein
MWLFIAIVKANMTLKIKRTRAFCHPRHSRHLGEASLPGPSIHMWRASDILRLRSELLGVALSLDRIDGDIKTRKKATIASRRDLHYHPDVECALTQPRGPIRALRPHPSGSLTHA